MKYIVSVAGREIEVEVDGDRVTVDGIDPHGHPPGHPRHADSASS